jgi:oxygen-independent coproporphyrinogen-3 oxidase
MTQDISFDADLIRRYDYSGPRYTSYPTAMAFENTFTVQNYAHQIALSNERGGPLSLYIHIPFCDTVCYYCACNKIITKNRGHATPYINSLNKEIDMLSTRLRPDRVVKQLHFGGGTPTFLTSFQLRLLMQNLESCFNFAPIEEREFSIEIDPRAADEDTIKLLAQLGFNRLSLGVQDFNGKVQKAVNRIQSEAETLHLMDVARKVGFKSISVDLIYGLPHQTVDSFSETLDKIIAASPDRLSVFNYAHMPEQFKVQRQIRNEDLPTAETKLLILQRSIEKLTGAGYVYIGMDHFAKPDDELTIAQENHQLYRNFQGYSTHADCDLFGLGLTSISKVGDAYIQNEKKLEDYHACIEEGLLPVMRGITLNADDKCRRDIINALICDFYLDIHAIELLHHIEFDQYFADIYPSLAQFADDGLLQYNEEEITVLPAGRLLIRHICMLFDRYSDHTSQRFSKVI